MVRHTDIAEIENFDGEFNGIPWDTLEKIATAHIRDVRERGGLDTRNCDSMDFLEVPIWALRETIGRVYMQGLNDATATNNSDSATNAEGGRTE